MTTPRIDTLRREIGDAIELLRYLAANAEDLHSLAYERHKGAITERTRGGSRDYALDTHGNPDARTLYAKTASTIIDMISRRGGVVELYEETRTFLTTGAASNKLDPSAAASADEVIAQVKARRRRLARGEYEPVVIAKQPVTLPSLDWETECEVLRAAVRKVTADFASDHQHCQPPEEGEHRYKRKLLRKYPTSRLSAREREAWRNAQSVVASATAAAS